MGGWGGQAMAERPVFARVARGGAGLVVWLPGERASAVARVSPEITRRTYEYRYSGPLHDTRRHWRSEPVAVGSMRWRRGRAVRRRQQRPSEPSRARHRGDCRRQDPGGQGARRPARADALRLRAGLARTLRVHGLLRDVLA